ncbi:MAG: SWIM zinc finger family protein, partial [Deltaproteobacteria bacterium]|nr:SWIM zinc finger family protein [Deltaproteobacteria bacterium]
MYYRRRFYYPRPSASQKRATVKKSLQRFSKNIQEFAPITLQGKTIAKTFWGQSWCQHFEKMADFENRLPRGRTYARNGSLVHLELSPGGIYSLVAGSDVYEVKINIKALEPDRWEDIKNQCHGKIVTMIDLLRGQFSKEVMAVVCHPKNGLFPRPDEITYSCSCPDFADLCKHVAAVFYGIGNRLDTSPELIFHLRQVDPLELLTVKADDLSLAKDNQAESIDESQLSDIFGIVLDLDLNPDVDAHKELLEDLEPNKDYGRVGISADLKVIEKAPTYKEEPSSSLKPSPILPELQKTSVSSKQSPKAKSTQAQIESKTTLGLGNDSKPIPKELVMAKETIKSPEPKDIVRSEPIIEPKPLRKVAVKSPPKETELETKTTPKTIRRPSAKLVEKSEGALLTSIKDQKDGTIDHTEFMVPTHPIELEEFSPPYSSLNSIKEDLVEDAPAVLASLQKSFKSYVSQPDIMTFKKVSQTPTKTPETATEAATNTIIKAPPRTRSKTADKIAPKLIIETTPIPETMADAETPLKAPAKTKVFKTAAMVAAKVVLAPKETKAPAKAKTATKAPDIAILASKEAKATAKAVSKTAAMAAAKVVLAPKETKAPAKAKTAAKAPDKAILAPKEAKAKAKAVSKTAAMGAAKVVLAPKETKAPAKAKAVSKTAAA